MKTTTLVMLIVVAMIAFSSCTPKSAMQTKAVVINPVTDDVGRNIYKINYIEYNVVGFEYASAGYVTGDTIYVHDCYRNIK